jgi:hypothetical protein
VTSRLAEHRRIENYDRCVDDDAMRALVSRLARPRRAGGVTVERAAIVAEGADADAVIAWIVAHGGQAEEQLASSIRHGLHGAQLHPSGGAQSRVPARFVLPSSALEADA